MEGTTSVPKSVPCLAVDKVRQVPVSEAVNSNVFVQNVPNKLISGDSSIYSLHLVLRLWVDM